MHYMFACVSCAQLDHEREQLTLREATLHSERAALEAEKEAMFDARVTDNDLVRAWLLQVLALDGSCAVPRIC